MNQILKIDKLYKNYQTRLNEINVLNNINLQVNKGDFIGIIGSSGSGKSTLLSIIANIEKPSCGSIIKDKNTLIGYMLQDDCLMPFLTILDNCLLGLKIKKEYTKENINKVKDMLKKYGLEEYTNSYPKDLSGGQRQRVALIRTLAISPDIILLDEPFSRLDYQTRLIVSNDIYNILKKEKKTLIMVTHDIDEALNICNRIVVLSNRPSKIKNIYNINYDKDDNFINNKTKEKYISYYNKIWKDIINDE